MSSPGGEFLQESYNAELDFLFCKLGSKNPRLLKTENKSVVARGEVGGGLGKIKGITSTLVVSTEERIELLNR